MESTSYYTGEEPKYMHYNELKVITECFNKELGRGGFGAVYKGKCQEKEVAVKVLLERSQGNQDKEFKAELLNLVKLSHQNIIRLVGYCCETYEKYNRRIDQLEPVTRSALCFEYAPNGNLRKYTFDANHRLDWHKVYNIIKGICEGLYYLHHHHSSGSMWHLDLKPENILLDHNMDPKIADFGLSKLFANPTTKVMQIGGTTDYVPPEYKLRGTVTNKFDVFSLGVIIIEIMAGTETYRILNDFDSDEDIIKLVLEKWNDILSGYCKQVKACIEIALQCVAIERKDRPEIKHIVDKLNEVDGIVSQTPVSQISSKYEGSSTWERDKVNGGRITEDISKDILNEEVGKGVDEVNSMAVHDRVPLPPELMVHMSLNTEPPNVTQEAGSKMSQRLKRKLLLSVHPLELQFSLGLGTNKLMNSRPLHLTNNTDNSIVYRLHTKYPKKHFEGFLCGIVLPMSTCTFIIAMRERLKLLPDNDELFVLESIVAGDHDMDHLRSYEANYQYEFFFTEAKQKGRAVHQVKLTAAYIQPGPKKQVCEPMMITSNIPLPTSIDVHPTEPWTMTSTEGDCCVYIWDYQTQQDNVSARSTEKKGLLKNYWQRFSNHYRDASQWDVREEVKSIFKAPSSQAVTSAKFIASKQWIVAGASDGSIYVYSYKREKKIHTMREHSGYITSLAIHATQPYMLSASKDGTVKLWNYRKDWELMKTIQMTPSQAAVRAVVFDPKGTDVFAAAQGSTVEIWNWRSCKRELVFSGPPNKVACLNYCSSGGELYLIASYRGNSTKGKIWDHTGQCVHELELHTSYVTAVCSHSDLQILITGSYDGSVHLWHSTTFRLMGRLNLGLGLIKDLKCLKDSRRIVIACYKGLALAEIDMIMGRA